MDCVCWRRWVAFFLFSGLYIWPHLWVAKFLIFNTVQCASKLQGDGDIRHEIHSKKNCEKCKLEAGGRNLRCMHLHKHNTIMWDHKWTKSFYCKEFYSGRVRVAGGCCSASLRDWSAQLRSLVFLSQTSQTKPSCCRYDVYAGF